MTGADSQTYDLFAPYYDFWADLARVTDDDVAFYRDLALAHRPGRCLELGVGTGRVLGALVAAGLDVAGVDASGPMLELAEARLMATPSAGHHELIHADFVEWQADAGSIAFAYSPYHTLPHLTEWGQWQRVFANVHRALVPGGQFAFSVAVPRSGDLAQEGWQEKGRFALGEGEAIVETRVTRNWAERRSTSDVRGRLVVDGCVRLDASWSFDLRLVRSEEVRDLAEATGFRVDDLSDSYIDRAVPPVDEQVWILSRRP